MSLCRQIQLLVTVLLLVMLVTILKVNLDGARKLATKQLSYSTGNITDLLAETLENHLSDPAQLESKINWIFDTGHFEKIVLSRLDGNVVYQREAEADISGAPSLFKGLISIDPPAVEADISDGNERFGTLLVKLNPAPFSAGLWATFKKLILLFVFLAAVTIAGSFLILNRFLKALNRIKQQAEAISRDEYIINENLPKTSELKQVTLAMNTMVAKVQDIFNRQLEDIKYFQDLQFIDTVTELHNRKFLIKRLNHFLDSDTEKAHGHFFLLAIVGMEQNNISSGHPDIQHFYKNLARIITDSAEQMNDAIVARLSQQEFGIILPDANTEEAMIAAEAAVAGSLELIEGKSELTGLIEISGGLAAYDYKDTAGSVLSKADYALSSAKNNPSGTIEFFQGEDNQAVMGKYQWQTMLHSALTNQRFTILSQPVLSAQGELHQEIYINLTAPNGQIYKAGYFMPMAISLGLSSRIDKYVLECIADYLKKSPEKVFAVNLTNVFCRDRLAAVWFRHFLETNQALSRQIYFEIHGDHMLQYPEICFDLTKLLQQMGFGFGIDQIILNDTSLNLFKEIKPAYIKIEKDYFEDIDGRGNSEVALNALLSLTDSLGIKLIVTKIEDEKQHQVLLSKKIKYFQGYAIASIDPLEPV